MFKELDIISFFYILALIIIKTRRVELELGYMVNERLRVELQDSRVGLHR